MRHVLTSNGEHEYVKIFYFSSQDFALLERLEKEWLALSLLALEGREAITQV